jgi:K+-transporting ATPase KdpF subunit
MTLISLLLSVAAFAYLVYAMLRPEKFCPSSASSCG